MLQWERRAIHMFTFRVPRQRRWAILAIVLLGICGAWFSTAGSALALETGIAFGADTGLASTDIRIVVARIIRTAFGLLGIIAVSIVLFGGFLWMTSGGEEDKISDAKRLLINGAIGLAIMLSAFAIAQFVLSRLEDAIGSGRGGGGGGALVDLGAQRLGSALGAGPIRSHYPDRDATGVPPNTRIFVTFREAVAAASFTEDTNRSGTYGTIGADASFDNNRDRALPYAVQVARVGADVDWTKLTAEQRGGGVFSAEAAKLTPVGVTLAPDGRTIVLTPIALADDGSVREEDGRAVRAQFAGNAHEPASYIVRLTGAVTWADGTPIFSGAFRDGYSWSFTVSADADNTPPTITRVVPFPDNGADTEAEGIVDALDQPRNALVQVTFSEVVDPTVTSGTYVAGDPSKQFAFLGVDGTWGDGAHARERVPGTWVLGSDYRTAEFTTFAACGQNTCGGTVFCLPGDARLDGFVVTAALEPGSEPLGMPFTGVTDAAGNALDGNRNGTAEGPGASPYTIGGPIVQAGTTDSAAWSFYTSNAIDLSPPTITSIVHPLRGSDVPATLPQDSGTPIEHASLGEPFTVTFSKAMSARTLDALSLDEVVGALGCDAETGERCLWHRASFVEDPEVPAAAGKVIAVRHAAFREATATEQPTYRSRVSSEATDLFQNCFFAVDAPEGPRGPRGGMSCVGAGVDEDCEPVP